MDVDGTSTQIIRTSISCEDTRYVQQQLEDMGGCQLPTDLMATSAPRYLVLGVLVFSRILNGLVWFLVQLATRVGLLGFRLDSSVFSIVHLVFLRY